MALARCQHCNWRMLGASHPEAVKAYHDHLRETHPEEWLRA